MCALLPPPPPLCGRGPGGHGCPASFPLRFLSCWRCGASRRRRDGGDRRHDGRHRCRNGDLFGRRHSSGGHGLRGARWRRGRAGRESASGHRGRRMHSRRGARPRIRLLRPFGGAVRCGRVLRGDGRRQKRETQARKDSSHGFTLCLEPTVVARDRSRESGNGNRETKDLRLSRPPAPISRPAPSAPSPPRPAPDSVRPSPFAFRPSPSRPTPKARRLTPF